MPDSASGESPENHPQKATSAVVLFLLLFFIGAVIGVYIFRGKPVVVPGKMAGVPSRIEIQPTKMPLTNLSLSPSLKILTVGEVLPLAVMIDGDPAQAVDIVLSYDPTIFTPAKVTLGDVFPQILQEQVKDGKIRVSMSVNPQNPKLLGKGTVFTINLSAISATKSSQVKFVPEETLVGRAGMNILSHTTNATFTVR